MKIAVLAPPYLPVPPAGYGGTERIVYHLTEGLVKRGHEVTLFASGDSKTTAKLFSTFPQSIGNSGENKNKPLLPLLSYIDCFCRANDFDIIHNHAQYYAMFLAELVITPVVHTIHGSFATGEVPEEKRLTLSRFKNQRYICISKNQADQMPELNWAGTVYNGIDINNFPFNGERGNYLLWIGRFSPKKGAIEAIETAKTCGLPLKLAGVIDPIDQPFFEQNVKPLIDGSQFQLFGELPLEEKAKLYREAYALLYPISWHEPFGLVMVEAMSCGTPVISFNKGSVPEIVKDGVNGFVVDSVAGMVDAVKKINSIKRSDCRTTVENNFTVDKMVEGYELIYKKILSI